MTKIYRGAKVVLVWLGEEEDLMSAIRTNCAIQQMQIAFSCYHYSPTDDMSRLKQTCDFRWNDNFDKLLEVSRPSHDYFHDKLFVPRLHSPEFQALLRLFQHP